jgi:hypothetical protein
VAECLSEAADVDVSLRLVSATCAADMVDTFGVGRGVIRDFSRNARSPGRTVVDVQR